MIIVPQMRVSIYSHGKPGMDCAIFGDVRDVERERENGRQAYGSMV